MLMRNIAVSSFAATFFCLTVGVGTSTSVRAQDAPPPPVPAVPAPATPAGSSQASSTDPLIGPIRKGDAVSIQVSGEPTLSGPQRISSEGTVTVPLAGPVNLAGLMPGDAAASISGLLKKKKLLRNPQVVVTIIGRPERTVSIAGAVEKQGRIILGDTTHLDEVLEPAGITPTSDLNRVIITRGDKKITVDYQAYRTGNDTSEGTNNPLIEDGDKIYIRARIQVAGTIKVNGEVKSPLATGLTNGMTVVQAIQQAGGVTDLADRDKVVLLRDGKELAVPLKMIQEGQTDKDLALQDKDEIFVRRLEKPKMFTVNGGVVRGSTYPLIGSVTLSDAIATAGGLLDRVDRKKITLQRKNDKGEVAVQTFDLNKMADASVVIQPEDIIAAPFPPEIKPKRDPLGLLSAMTSILFFFRR